MATDLPRYHVRLCCYFADCRNLSFRGEHASEWTQWRKETEAVQGKFECLVNKGQILSHDHEYMCPECTQSVANPFRHRLEAL